MRQMSNSEVPGITMSISTKFSISAMLVVVCLVPAIWGARLLREEEAAVVVVVVCLVRAIWVIPTARLFISSRVGDFGKKKKVEG